MKEKSRQLEYYYRKKNGPQEALDPPKRGRPKKEGGPESAKDRAQKYRDKKKKDAEYFAAGKEKIFNLPTSATRKNYRQMTVNMIEKVQLPKRPLMADQIEPEVEIEGLHKDKT